MRRLRRIKLLPVIVLLLVAIGPRVVQAKIVGIGTDQGAAKSFAFTAKAGHIKTPDGSSPLFWGFAETNKGVQFPGPTLILKQGDTVTITLTNQLAEPVSMLFPGLTMTSSTSPVIPAGDRSRLTSLAPEAAANGGTQTYSFIADRPGTFYYQSGSNLPVQLRMGLHGAIIVRPAQDGTTKNVNISVHNLNDPNNQGVAASTWPFTRFAYNDNAAVENLSTGYDREYLFLVSEMDPKFNSWVEFETDKVARPFDFSKWKANYWFINGRCAPDTMSPVNAAYLPTQPYNSAPLMHPAETVLMRFINMGSDPHPFHTHGNHMRVVGEDGLPLSSGPSAGADLSWQAFTLTLQPGKTYEATYTWTGERIGWDIYGHTALADPRQPYEYLGDHGKTFTPNRPAVSGTAQTPAPSQALPVILPTIEEAMFGMWNSGSPFMGSAGALPPGEGGMNPFNGFFYMWHSHAERELTNNNIWPGGLLTMLGIVPWSSTLDENDTYNPGM